MTKVFSSTSKKAHVHFLSVLALPLIALAGCGGTGFPNRESASTATTLSVIPRSITVAAGSVTPFRGVFAPTSPDGGSLTWAVTPVNAGTISDAGVFTASSTAGTYSILATWTPAVLTTSAVIIEGSAAVIVLAVPQLNSVNSPAIVQASGGNQFSGTIQNSAIVGQPFPSANSIDSSGNVQVRSGFTPPVACSGTTTSC